MLVTIAFIVGLAWSIVVIVAADQHGRAIGWPYRVAIALAVFGILLVLPCLLVGTYGLPANWSYQWLGIVARVGYAGLALAATGAGAWLLLDTVFVWRERHRVFPFSFRRPPRSEA